MESNSAVVFFIDVLTNQYFGIRTYFDSNKDLIEEAKKMEKVENIKSQMSLLSNLRCFYDDTHYIDLEYNELEKQLKELENGICN